jgi:uncharacterized protein YuzE
MVMPMPRLEYDAEADALYIYLRDFDRVARTESRIDISRNIDYDVNGEPVGVEFWNVHRGLNLDGVPQHDTIVRLLEGHHFKIFA